MTLSSRKLLGILYFFNTDLDGTIFTYKYRVWLAYVMTSHQIVSCKLDPWHPYDTFGCRKWKLCVRGWSKVMTYASRVVHDSRKYKSYHLNWPLQYLCNIWISLIILHAHARSKNPLAPGYQAWLSLHTGKSKLPT